MKLLFFVLSLLVFKLMGYSNVYAEVLNLGPSTINSTPGIKFQVLYSLGKINGEVLMMGGKMILDTDNPSATNGQFKVPIDSLYTTKPMQDCHIREALGLNYDYADYPSEHVCSEKFQVPFEGKNAIAYPIISFKIDSLQSLNQSKHINLNNSVSGSLVEVFGTWSIHGISLPTHFPLTMRKHGKNIKISGETFISLKNYEVTVKAPKILLIPLKVEDKVKIIFDIDLEILK